MKPKLSRDLLKKMYKTMVTIRSFENEALRMNARKLLPGFIHSYIGEEGSATGACCALNDDDYIVSNHRGHGHVIAKGCDLKPMMAELFGKSTGCCHGKGGSMHIADFKKGIIGANGIVGAGLPIAVGAALASKMEAKGEVVLCFFGDGASNQGTFHESMNMASIWDLPVVFVCENNLYAVSTPQSYHQRVKDVSERAPAYRIPGKTVDGNNVISVYEEVLTAVKRARNGKGPSIVETKTYRWYGHCEADPPAIYRTKEEVENWKKKCPIERFRTYLLNDGIFNNNELAKIDNEVEKNIEEAVEFAKNSPEPALESALQDIYYEESTL